MTDSIDYIFRFLDRTQAQLDLIVGPYFAIVPSSVASQPTELLVYPNSQVDSVTPASGYWCVITTSGVNSALAASPNLQITNDRTLQLAGQPSVLSAAFDVSHMVAVYSNFGTYAANGLRPV